MKSYNQRLSIYKKNLKQYESQVEEGDIEDDDKAAKPEAPVPPRELIASSFES